MFMKRKLKSDRGFTLAELLIVVAIIGVLVAIAIPIFTSQLERSREAVDLSDVRSAYAEVMMAAITGDTSATYTKDSGQTIYENGEYSITVTPLKQQKDGWQTPLPITIGGVSSSASEPYWVGAPGAGGSCKITYHPPTSTGDEYVSFYWTGGTDNGNNPNLTPVPTQPIFPIETPTPTTIPDAIATDRDSVLTNWKSSEWPDEPAVGETISFWVNYGQIFSYHGEYYVVANGTGYGAEFKSNKTQNYGYWKPSEVDRRILHITSTTPRKWSDAIDKNLTNLSVGDLYIAENGDLYVSNTDSSIEAIPNGNGTSQWIKVSK